MLLKNICFMISVDSISFDAGQKTSARVFRRPIGAVEHSL